LNFTKGKRSWWLAVITLAAGVVVALANIDGALSFVGRFTTGAPSSTMATPETQALPASNSLSAIAPASVTPVTTTPAPSSTIAGSATRTTSAPSSTNAVLPAPDGWYELTGYQSVAWNNGFDPVDPIRIGSASFPSSIVGYYPSSSSDPMNRATWTVGGACDRFSAWIGKDAESPSSAGVGRFVVKADDRDVFTGEMSMKDAARELDIDISGAVRLMLFDTRGSQDAKNAWGNPRVHCAAPPGRKR